MNKIKFQITGFAFIFFSMTLWPCEANVSAFNDSSNSILIIMPIDEQKYEVQPGEEILLSTDLENVIYIKTSDTKYLLYYGDAYDHWFNSVHNELITVTDHDIHHIGTLHWDILQEQ